MMNKTLIVQVLHGSLPVLLTLLLVGGCSVFPREIRYDTNTISYYSPEDGVTSRSGEEGVTSTSGQYEDATAYYISRDGGDVPKSTVMKVRSQQESQFVLTEEQPPAKDMPMVIEVSDVLFDFDKWVIKTPFFPVLDRWVEYFMTHPSVTAHIFGHTDSTGPIAYNQKLSEKRAQSVVNYLVAKGVSAGLLAAKGFGESKPVAPNSTKEGRQKNRRVELDL